jgi:hypothetical protein
MALTPKRAFLVIFLVAIPVRVYLLTLIPLGAIYPDTRWEVEAVAYSLYETGNFADPYLIPTGPTAHMPPLYVGFLALLYHLFGLTLTAGYIAWSLKMLSYSVLFSMLPWVSGKLGLGRQAGTLAGLAGALIPAYPSEVEPLAALAMAVFLVHFLRRWKSGSSNWSSVFFGLAWGAAFHVKPSLLPVVLGCLVFEVWWNRKREARQTVIWVLLGIVLACAPWTWRNYQTFGTLMFIRGNLGLELRVGNHEGASADIDVSVARGTIIHPRINHAEAVKVRELGEAEYNRQAGGEAVAWIHTHSAAFLKLTVTRFVYFWTGSVHRPLSALVFSVLTLLALLGIWQAFPSLTTPQKGAILIPLLTYPLVYYVVAYMPRYREPLDWLLIVLGGFAVWNLLRRFGASSNALGNWDPPGT